MERRIKEINNLVFPRNMPKETDRKCRADKIEPTEIEDVPKSVRGEPQIKKVRDDFFGDMRSEEETTQQKKESGEKCADGGVGDEDADAWPIHDNCQDKN